MIAPVLRRMAYGVGLLALPWILAACVQDDAAGDPLDDDDVVGDDDAADDDDAVDDDTAADDDGADDDDAGDDDTEPTTDPYADAVVSFTPGDYAGFGSQDLPDIVLGAPQGAGAHAGSLDVLSLGDGGEVILEFTDIAAIDGPGVDLIVFENPFSGWTETGHVAVSEDGVSWHEFPCDPEDGDGDYPGCAGVNPVLSSPDNGIDPMDHELAGGDAFDLAGLGLTDVRFVRITDSGFNTYGGIMGGFDLDAVVIVQGQEIQ